MFYRPDHAGRLQSWFAAQCSAPGSVAVRASPFPSTAQDPLKQVIRPHRPRKIQTPTGHSKPFGPSSAVPGPAYPLPAPFVWQCLNSRPDATGYYALC